MRIKILRSVIPVLLLLSQFGCDILYTEVGNGEITTTFRSYDDFDRIEISGNYEVVLEEDPSNTGVEIKADDNLLEHIITDIRGSSLMVYSETRLKGTETIKLTIHYDKVDQIEISGAAQLENTGVMRCDKLVVQMSGAGATDLDVETNSLIIEMSGAGSVVLRGSTDVQRISLSGAGSLEAFGLMSNSATVEISGVGTAQLFVAEDLDASVSGVGGIIYKGAPRVIKSVSGLGKVVGHESSDL